MNKLEKFKDLPEYGTYVLVYGKDEKMYDQMSFHVACMDDLEDGCEFTENGNFNWLTEAGRKITNVTHWTELPKTLT